MKRCILITLIFICFKLAAQDNYYQHPAKSFEAKVTALIKHDQYAHHDYLLKTFNAAIDNKANVVLKSAANTYMSSSEAYKRLKHSTLIVGHACYLNSSLRIRVFASTGYVISEDGYFVTNNHVAAIGVKDEVESMFVATYDGQVFPVTEIVARDTIHDLAICKAHTGNSQLKPVSVNTEVKRGEKVRSIHHPSGLYYYNSEGAITNEYFVNNNQSSRFAISAQFANKSSGGPIFDQYGNVIATIASSKAVYEEFNDFSTPLKMVYYNCIPIKYIEQLIKPIKELGRINNTKI